MVVLKFQFNNEIRRVTVDNFGFSFSQLQELARNLYGNNLPKELTFKYKDDEGDMITVSSEQELQEAIRLASTNQLLRVFIEAKKNDSVPSSDDSFMKVLEKLVLDNPVFKNIIDNFDIEVKSIPASFAAPFQVKVDVETPTTRIPVTPVRPVHFAICDACEQTIVGDRFKCKQCPDYDLCEKCEPNKENVHNKDHSYEKMTHPHPFPHGRFGGCHRSNSNSNSNSLPNAARSGRCPRFNAMNVPQSEVVHPAVCDSCHNRIKGIRNKCQQCPDFDLCEKCFSEKIHSEHAFIQITRPWGRCTRNDRKPEQKAETPVQESTEKPVVVPAAEPVVEEKPAEVPVEEKKEENPVAEPTPVAEPVPVVEPTPVPMTPFEQKLKQLEEMGFVNKQRNIELLVQHKGDMLQAVKYLLEN